MTQDEINAKDKAEAAARIKAAAKAAARNHVKRLREDRLMSKAELARKAGVSALTIDRIEAGMPCRMDTKRKIILALGMTIDEKDKVFEREANPEGGEPSEQ